VVSSEIALPGLLPASSAPPAVIVRFGDVPYALDGATTIRSTYQISGDRLLLRVPGIARFLTEAGREITVALEDATPAEDTAVFIIGTVFGILLHQRGQVVLHASAVCVNGKAVLFCGPSGAGKSTMAAALGERGYPMLTDDLSVITTDAAGTLHVQPDARQLRLWTLAIDKLGLIGRRRTAVRDALQKFHVEPAAASADARPLGPVYILRETRPSMRDGIAPCHIADTAKLVRRSAYRPSLVHAFRQHAHYLRSAAGIAAQAGVFALNRPIDFVALPLVVRQLEDHWRERGLLGGAQ
jgi:hypothetical protein